MRIETVHAALENWGRWVRVRQAQGHCASIEYRYRSKLRPDETPTGWGDWREAPPVPPLPPVDTLQALEIERCMRHLPDGHRKALKLAYVYRMPSKLICLRLALNKLDYDRFMGDARAMVAAVFKRRCTVTVEYDIRTQIRLPAFAETTEPLGFGCIG